MQPPVLYPDRDWPQSTAAGQGMDPVILEKMYEAAGSRNIHTIVIVRNGRMIAERHFGGDGPGAPCSVYSVTKSVLAALTGMALAGGAVSLDQTLAGFFPILSDDPVKSTITLRHLLTMTSGFDWTEWGTWDSRSRQSNMADRMRSSSDWVDFVLRRPLASRPGERFNYCSGGSHLLAVVLQMALGEDLLIFARRNLFTPLGITDFSWDLDPRGVLYGGSGLRLTPADMARFGHLFLCDGRWNGQPILSPEWVRACWNPYTPGYPEVGSYGYHWWVWSETNSRRPQGVNFAMGYGGQFVFVVPAANLVAVFTGRNPGNRSTVPAVLLSRYVLNAVGD